MKNWTNKARVYTEKKKKREIIIPLLKYIYIYLTSDFLLYKNIFFFHKTDTNFEHDYTIVYHVFSCLTSGAFSMYSFF